MKGRMTRRPERGQIIIMLALMMVVLLGLGALVVDVGIGYLEKTRMQAVADAAALAGANELPDENCAEDAARQVFEENHYALNQNGVVGMDLIPNPDGNHPGRYQVRLSRAMPAYFSRVLGYSQTRLEVQATAVSLVHGSLSISGGGTYGVDGIQNLSVFGPYAYYSYGDCYSPQFFNDGSRNPYYRPSGYDFDLYVPADYAEMQGTSWLWVEIFDPETRNQGDAANAGPGRIDEIRKAPKGGHPQPKNKYTTTRYQLFSPNDVLIASATYGPKDGVPDDLTDMQWVLPAGFEIDTASWGTGHYRLNVKTLDGSSENGFNLRAGPPTEEFDPDNGTTITAIGYLPTNFNVSGTITIEFGYIPSDAAGGSVFVKKFDTDVGAKSITYYDDLGNTWSGVLAGNGTFAQDQLDIPEGYPGSTLYASYEAGSQDTSVWELHYESRYGGRSARIFLID